MMRMIKMVNLKVNGNSLVILAQLKKLIKLFKKNRKK